MSLKLWMPLTEDMRNQGLYETNPGANGGIFETGGKLGKCLKTSGAIDTGLPYTEWNYSTDSITMCCWVKFNLAELRTALPQSITGSNYTTPTGNLLGFNSYGGLAIIWSTNNVYSNGQVNYVYLSGCYRSGDNSKVTNSYTIPFDTWIHVALVFNKTSNIMRLYINGSVHNEIVMPSTTTVSQSNFRINANAVWGGNGPTKAIPFRINDVRCYNNALSTEEVKEISKGLILHYPLNDTQILTNAFSYPTFDTPTNTGGWKHWGPSGATASYSYNTNKDYIFNKNNTYSHKFQHTAGSYFICYQEPAFDGGYRSAQAIIKMAGGEYPHNITWTHNANVGTNPPTTFTSLGDGFYLMKHEGFRQDGSNDLVSIYINNNVTVYISEAYLENNRQFCSNLFKTTNVVYDSSGFHYDGTINGTCSDVPGSPRYEKCINLPEATTLTCANPFAGQTTQQEWSISCWVKASALTNWTSKLNNFNTGNYLKTADNQSILYLNSGVNDYYSYAAGCPQLNTWTHVVFVFRNSDGLRQVWINGVQKASNGPNKTSTPLGMPATIEWFTAYGGDVSDLRLYATALSSSDIQYLYSLGN